MLTNGLNKHYAKRVLTLLAIVFYGIGFSQAQINLIPNPSFEGNTGIPLSYSEFNKCNDWYSVIGTPDYLSNFSPIIYNTFSCSVNSFDNATGKQIPRNGNFMSGIFLRTINTQTPNNFPFIHYFEMIGNELNTNLNKNHIYDFTLNYSFAEVSDYITNELSILFTDTQYVINNLNVFSQNSWDNYLNNVKPQVKNDTAFFLNQDTLNWQTLNKCFIAEGNEKYLTIGHFKDAKKSKILSVDILMQSVPLILMQSVPLNFGIYS
jgi:hypothetical protein